MSKMEKGDKSVMDLQYLYPRKLCLWEGILVSRCPNDRVSVTFCFLNILKNY